MAIQKKAKDATKKTAACGGGDGEEVPIRVVKGEERDTDTAERAEKTARKRDGNGRFVKQNAEPPKKICHECKIYHVIKAMSEQWPSQDDPPPEELLIPLRAACLNCGTEAENAAAPAQSEADANAAKPETPAPEKKPEDSGAPDDGSTKGETDNAASEKLPVYYVGIEDTPFGRLAFVRSNDGTPPMVFLNNRRLDESDTYIVGKLLESASCLASKYKRKARAMAALFIGAIVGWMGSVAALLGVILAK